MNGDMTYTLIMGIILIAVFYLFMIRPESKRKKQQEEMRSNLRKGDQITTIGGVVGRVVKIEDNTIIIETSEDRVRMEFAKWAVSTVGVQKSIEDTNNNKKNRKKRAVSAAARRKPYCRRQPQQRTPRAECAHIPLGSRRGRSRLQKPVLPQQTVEP